MSVMILESASQAFKEPADVPKRFDVQSGAWVETSGMTYDDASGAWTERWSPNKKLLLYDNGTFYNITKDNLQVTSYGWNGYTSYNSGYHSASPFMEIGDTYIKITQNNVAGAGCVFVNIPIDFSKYSTLELDAIIVGESPSCGIITSIRDNYTKVYDLQNGSNDISSILGEYYIGFSASKSYNDSIASITIRKILLKQ